MAVFKPCLINKSQLENFPISIGQYIVCPDTSEIFIDVSSNNRKQLQGKLKQVSIGGKIQQVDINGLVDIDAPILSNTASYWSSHRDFIPYKGQVIIYEDYQEEYDNDGKLLSVSNLKIGDGTTSVVSLSFFYNPLIKIITEHINNKEIHVTQQEREFWNNKVSCQVDDSKGIIKFSTN